MRWVNRNMQIGILNVQGFHVFQEFEEICWGVLSPEKDEYPHLALVQVKVGSLDPVLWRYWHNNILGQKMAQGILQI